MESDSQLAPAAVRYRLSGKLGRRPLLIPSLVIAGSMIAGLAWGALDPHLDWLKLKWGIAGFLGFGIAWVTIFLARFAHCRNKPLVVFTAFAAALAAAYCAALGLAIAGARICGIAVSPAALVSNPVALFQTLDAISNAGALLHRGKPLSSEELWFQWIFQRLFMLGAAIPAAYAFVTRQIYCEGCQTWLDIARHNLRFPMPAHEAMADLEQGQLGVLVDRPPHSATQTVRPPYIRLDYVLCHACGNMGVFRVLKVQEGSGSERVRETKITGMLELDPGRAAQFALLIARDKEAKGISKIGKQRIPPKRRR